MSDDASDDRHHESSETAAKIEAFHRTFEVARRSDKKRDNRHLAVSIVSGLLYFAALVASVISAFQAVRAVHEAARAADEAKRSADAAHDTLIAANRAWLAPTHFEIVKQIDDPDGPSFSGHFQNIGRFPALDVKPGFGWQAISLKRPIRGPNDVPEGDLLPTAYSLLKASCWATQPIEGGLSVFPAAPETDATSGPSQAPGNKANILSGDELIFLVGCLTYRTFGEVHHTSFCGYLTKARTGQWEFIACQGGNYAD